MVNSNPHFNVLKKCKKILMINCIYLFLTTFYKLLQKVCVCVCASVLGGRQEVMGNFAAMQTKRKNPAQGIYILCDTFNMPMNVCNMDHHITSNNLLSQLYISFLNVTCTIQNVYVLCTININTFENQSAIHRFSHVSSDKYLWQY